MMLDACKIIVGEVRCSWRKFLAWGLACALFAQLLMLVALVVRFDSLPNYSTAYNWPGNVIQIIESTPSWRDISVIVWEEWLFEIGKMNYDYGIGISEWSLNVLPSRLLVLSGLGFLCALFVKLLNRRTCSLATKSGAAVVAGSGSVMIAMTNATMSWVVCCATPSWVVGLAMMGLGVSTSLALESLGPLLMASGLIFLCTAITVLAWRLSQLEQAGSKHKNEALLRRDVGQHSHA